MQFFSTNKNNGMAKHYPKKKGHQNIYLLKARICSGILFVSSLYTHLNGNS
jgi:hypothetical protein